MNWHAADKMPERKAIIFVRDNRITIKATSDALAEARKDGIMVFKGNSFIAIYVLGRRLI